MSRRVPLAVVFLVLARGGVWGRERVTTVDVGGLNAITPITTNTLKLPLDTPLKVQAPATLDVTRYVSGVAQNTQKGLTPMAVPQELKALPQSVVPLNAQMAVPQAQAPVAHGVDLQALGRDDDKRSPEEIWAAGNALFDALDGRAKNLADMTLVKSDDPVMNAYREARKAAKKKNWAEEESQALIEAARTLWAKQGVEVEYVHNVEGNRGLRVLAKKGVSPLNDMAFEAQRAFGATLDYFPQRTGDGTAGYTAAENRLMAPGLDRDDFYIGMLHELRHAWYASLLRRGQFRLFHVQALAHPYGKLRAASEVYEQYMSFEELSAYPKTLKHMVVELKRADPGRRARLQDLAITRSYHLFDLLKTSAHLADQILRLQQKDRLKLTRVSETTARLLNSTPDVEHFQLELPQGRVFIPVPKRRKQDRLGFKTYKASPNEAAARLALSARLVTEMNMDIAPDAVAYLEALRAFNWEEADRLSGRIVTRVAKAEKAWLDAEPKS